MCCVPGAISGHLDQYSDIWPLSLMSINSEEYLLFHIYDHLTIHSLTHTFLVIMYKVLSDIYKYFTFGNHIFLSHL